MADSAITSRRFDDYNRAIEINPKYAEAYYNRGIAYGNSAITGRRFQITTEPSRSILNMQRHIITVVSPMANSATTIRRFQITTGLSRSILNMPTHIITVVLPMENLATARRRLRTCKRRQGLTTRMQGTL